MGKEFLLTLYDELKHKSLSKKMQDFQYGLSSQMYTKDKLKKVRDQIYQIVRMPY